MVHRDPGHTPWDPTYFLVLPVLDYERVPVHLLSGLLGHPGAPGYLHGYNQLPEVSPGTGVYPGPPGTRSRPGPGPGQPRSMTQTHL